MVYLWLKITKLQAGPAQKPYSGAYPAGNSINVGRPFEDQDIKKVNVPDRMFRKKACTLFQYTFSLIGLTM